MTDTGSAAIVMHILAVFVAAGFVKGMVGMGLPAVAMGLLCIVMPPAQAASVLILPTIITNIWQLAGGPAFGALLRRLWLLMAGTCLGIWLGSDLMTGPHSRTAAFGLGCVLAVYAVLGLASLRMHVAARQEPWLSPLVGVATGLIAGATGVFAFPLVPYLASLRFDRAELIQALGLSFMVSTLALAASLIGREAFAWSLAVPSAIALVPALLGMAAGQWLRRRVHEETFRRCFLVGLFSLGVYIAGQNLP